MTQPIHPAAIPALVGAGVGAVTGILGEAARTSGMSNGRVFTYKTAAFTATAATFHKNAPAAAGAATGFIIGERVGTAAATATGWLAKTLYNATTYPFRASYRMTCNGITRARNYTHARYEGTKEGLQLTWAYTKLIGGAMKDAAVAKVVDCCKRPFARRPAPAPVALPAALAPVAVGAPPAAPAAFVYDNDDAGAPDVQHAVRQGGYLGARGHGGSSVRRGLGSQRGRGQQAPIPVPVAENARGRGRGRGEAPAEDVAVRGSGRGRRGGRGGS